MRRETRGRPYRKIPVYRTEFNEKLGKLEVFVGYEKVVGGVQERRKYINRPSPVSSFAPAYRVDSDGTVLMDERQSLPAIVKRKDNPQAWHNRQVEQARSRNL